MKHAHGMISGIVAAALAAATLAPAVAAPSASIRTDRTVTATTSRRVVWIGETILVAVVAGVGAPFFAVRENGAATVAMTGVGLLWILILYSLQRHWHSQDQTPSSPDPPLA